MGRKRPCHCTTSNPDELAPPHCPSHVREAHRSGSNWEVGSGQVSAGNVRFGSKADILHCGKERRYSITSSARESTVGDISKPSAFAVLRLITSLNFVDCTTGRSVGLVPLRIRPT